MTKSEFRAKVKAVKGLCWSVEQGTMPPEEFIANLGLLAAGLLAAGLLPAGPLPEPGLVFCGPCIHYSSGYSDREWEHCAKGGTVKITNHIGIGMWRESPAEKNAANDCRDFRTSEEQRRQVTRRSVAGLE